MPVGLRLLLWSYLCASRLVFPVLCLRSTRPGYSHLLCPCYFYVFLGPYLTDSVSLISYIVVVIVLVIVVVDGSGSIFFGF